MKKSAFSMSVLGRLLASSMATLALGCVPEFDDNVGLVDEFRVLAVRSDPAEVAPGGQVALTVLWATPEGETVESDDVSWGLCTQRKELTEPGPVSPLCIEQFGDEDSEIIEYLGSGDAVDASLPSDGCRTFGPLAPPPEEGSTVPGRPVDPDLTGGFYQPVLVGESAATLGGIRMKCGTPWLPSEELIVFNQGYRPNEHPDFARLERADGDDWNEVDLDEPLFVKVGDELRLRVGWAACPREPECGDGLCTMGENGTNCAGDCRTDPVGCTGAEDYLVADVETRTALPTRENVSVAWFSTGGRFESSVTDDPEHVDSTENAWVAPDEPASLGLWLVLRDDRGGVTWRSLEVSVVEQ